MARSKYRPLQEHLEGLARDEWRATFRDVERVLGFVLPASARTYPAWWSNEENPGMPQMKAWQDAGWRTSELNLTAERVIFRRVRGTHRLARGALPEPHRPRGAPATLAATPEEGAAAVPEAVSEGAAASREGQAPGAGIVSEEPRQGVQAERPSEEPAQRAEPSLSGRRPPGLLRRLMTAFTGWAAPADAQDKTPPATDVAPQLVAARFEWRHLGAAALDATGRLVLPAAPRQPGVYRFAVQREDKRSVYVGESDNLSRRMVNYRTPGVRQQTNLRLNELLCAALMQGAAIEVAVITDAVVSIGEARRAADFSVKAERVLLEHAALVASRAPGVALLNK